MQVRFRPLPFCAFPVAGLKLLPPVTFLILPGPHVPSSTKTLWPAGSVPGAGSEVSCARADVATSIKAKANNIFFINSPPG